MAKRKKFLLIGTAFLLVAALGCALFGGRGKMDVQLVFVAYTNSTITRSNLYGDSRDFTFDVIQALTVVTNSGSTPVSLKAVWRRHAVPVFIGGTQLVGGVSGLDVRNLPAILPPGKATTITFELNEPMVPWSIEMAAISQGSRYHSKVQAVPIALARRWLEKLFPPPLEMLMKLGPITNLPPDKPPGR